jgi:hypothetical protein
MLTFKVSYGKEVVVSEVAILSQNESVAVAPEGIETV